MTCSPTTPGKGAVNYAIHLLFKYVICSWEIYGSLSGGILWGKGNCEENSLRK